jgi:3-hydroxyisobutyrate dehydrogenase
MTKVGICGTGKMGSEIAKRLLDCNQDLFVWNRTASKAQLLSKNGAKVKLSLSE